MGERAATVLVLVVTWLVAATVAGAQAPSEGSPYELPEPPPQEEPTPEPEDPGAGPPAMQLLTPAPVVRISGKLTRTGATITRLQIKTPPLVRVVVRCTGKRKGCPTKRRARVVPDSQRRVVRYRLRRFERTYEAGAVLKLLVARRGTVGKYAKFKIRKGKAPKRRDACVAYGTTRPRACTAVVTEGGSGPAEGGSGGGEGSTPATGGAEAEGSAR